MQTLQVGFIPGMSIQIIFNASWKEHEEHIYVPSPPFSSYFPTIWPSSQFLRHIHHHHHDHHHSGHHHHRQYTGHHHHDDHHHQHQHHTGQCSQVTSVPLFLCGILCGRGEGASLARLHTILIIGIIINIIVSIIIVVIISRINVNRQKQWWLIWFYFSDYLKG